MVQAVRPVLTVVFLLAGVLVIGCNEESQPPSRGDQASRQWKRRYENLVRQKEEDDARIEQLTRQKSDLQGKITHIESELEKRSARAQRLEGVRSKLDAREKTIGELEKQVEVLREELAEQEKAGGEDPDLRRQLEEARARSDAACRQLREAGAELLDAGRYRHARNALEGAVELGGEDALVLYRLAYCHGLLGDPAEAARTYGQAIAAARRAPDRMDRLLPRLYSNRGAALVTIERFEDALGAYEEAVKLDPDYAPVYFNLGRLYARHLEQSRKALEAYRRHVALGGQRGASAREAIEKLLDAQQTDQ